MNKLAIALIVAIIVVIALVIYFLVKQETAKAQMFIGPGGGGVTIPQCTTLTNIQTITYVPPIQTITYSNTWTTMLTKIPVTTYICPQ